jgi:hypothetical protein
MASITSGRRLASRSKACLPVPLAIVRGRSKLTGPWGSLRTFVKFDRRAGYTRNLRLLTDGGSEALHLDSIESKPTSGFNGSGQPGRLANLPDMAAPDLSQI